MEPRDFEQHISIKNLAPIHVGKRWQMVVFVQWTMGMQIWCEAESTGKAPNVEWVFMKMPPIPEPGINCSSWVSGWLHGIFHPMVFCLLQDFGMGNLGSKRSNIVIQAANPLLVDPTVWHWIGRAYQISMIKYTQSHFSLELVRTPFGLGAPHLHILDSHIHTRIHTMMYIYIHVICIYMYV